MTALVKRGHRARGAIRPTKEGEINDNVRELVHRSPPLRFVQSRKTSRREDWALQTRARDSGPWTVTVSIADESANLSALATQDCTARAS
jgi:hypothetical protein